MLVGEEAINFNSLSFVLFPTPTDMILTDESFSRLIGAFNVPIPPVAIPSVMTSNT